jgi:hypothetical protein
VGAGGFEGAVFRAKGEAAGVLPNADCVPDVDVNVLNGEVVLKGDAEIEGLGIWMDDDAVVVGVLAITDFGGSGLAIPNTDVILPNAFGVVARLEKADCVGWDEVGGVSVLLNGLEGMAEADGSPKTDCEEGLRPKLFMSHSEPFG